MKRDYRSLLRDYPFPIFHLRCRDCDHAEDHRLFQLFTDLGFDIDLYVALSDRGWTVSPSSPKKKRFKTWRLADDTPSFVFGEKLDQSHVQRLRDDGECRDRHVLLAVFQFTQVALAEMENAWVDEVCQLLLAQPPGFPKTSDISSDRLEGVLHAARKLALAHTPAYVL